VHIHNKQNIWDAIQRKKMKSLGSFVVVDRNTAVCHCNQTGLCTSLCHNVQQEKKRKKNPNLIKASLLLHRDSEVTTALSSPLSHDASQPPPLQREEM
jgi:hypothetical protein